jgi:hypothetical protein
MARTKKNPAKEKRPTAGADARYRERLIRWAELVDRVGDLMDAIEAAWHDDVIGEDTKDDANGSLLEAYDSLRSAAPTRRAL